MSATQPKTYKPRGVQLRDPSDFDTLRTQIGDKALAAVKETFPKSFGGVRLEVDELHYGPEPDMSPEAETKALLNDKYVTRQLKGNLRLFDETTGALLDERKATTVMNVPWLSRRGTFIHRGNHYTSAAQMRLVPGTYGRIMDNGNVEVHANMRPGTGTSWRLMLEPESGQLRLRVGPSSGLHLYSLWKDLGVHDDEIKSLWGEGTWKINADNYNPRTLGMAYKRFVPQRLQVAGASVEEQRAAVLEALNKGKVLASVLQRNLPAFFDRSKMASIGESLNREDDLNKLFKPDLTPDDMHESYQSVYGKHGPRLASMQRWPERWINKALDPMGWMEWYMNYHEGRRSSDDARQIRRWLRMKRTHGAEFAKAPTPRRAFALRNWAIDPLKLVDESARPEVEQSMKAYRDKAWEEWADKKAAFDLGDLQALALHLNQTSQAGIDLNATAEDIETSIKSFLMRDSKEDNAWLRAAEEAKVASVIGAFMRHDADAFDLQEDGGRLKVSHGGRSILL